MKIGALITFRPNTDIEASFRKLREMELSCCQFDCWEPSLYTDENVEKIRKAASAYQIEITGFWAGWSGPRIWNFVHGPSTLGIVPPAYRSLRLQELDQGSLFAQKLGVSDVITHVGFLPEVPNDPDFVGTVAALKWLTGRMKERGQVFLFETGQETPVTMLRAIEAIGADNLGVNLDTANLILYGKANPLDALDVFGKYVRNLHCKDGLYPTSGIELGQQVPLGQGKANIAAIIHRLKDFDYQGPYIIEREILGDQQIQDIILARDLLRKILREENL